jgi:hypothetical protein
VLAEPSDGYWTFLVGLLAFAHGHPVLAQGGPGDLDPGFDPGTILASGGQATIHGMVVESNGSVIVVGDFTSIGGVTRDRIARFNPNGTLDNSFNPGTGANGPVHAIVEFEGYIWAGGDFTEFNDIALNRIVQLTSNGLPYVVQRLTGGCNGPVHAFAARTAYQEALFVGGEFTMIGGQPRNRLAQIDDYGRLDPFFSVWANGAVRAIHLQAESSYGPPSGLVVGGDFTALNGLPRNRIARLSLTLVEIPDCPYEEGFVAQVDGAYAAGGGADGSVFALGAWSDGTLFAAGNFANVSGSPPQCGLDAGPHL